ncbi:septal ring lytic transglycosylase RlpA family protein [Flavobacterium sp. FlaQc-47]|uniref:septal ring lytic transglycosylase RlpA family protein n=1 Tax=Flavobacterium sp. FlaQc-47 TaxID=3374180 RepID=UPI0037580661
MKKLLLYTVFLIALSANAQQNPTSTIEEIKIEKLKRYKENVHASYYHDKFTGRKTASGTRFDNNKLTAAHKKLPFGTILKVTNKINQKSVIVKVNDRGPFINGREIDLSKKAFMDITSNKKSGGMIVTIEIVEN